MMTLLLSWSLVCKRREIVKQSSKSLKMLINCDECFEGKEDDALKAWEETSVAETPKSQASLVVGRLLLAWMQQPSQGLHLPGTLCIGVKSHD